MWKVLYEVRRFKEKDKNSFSPSQVDLTLNAYKYVNGMLRESESGL